MKFINQGANVYIPDNVSLEEAQKRASGGGMAIGAHQDDLEIFAMHGIGNAYNRFYKMFTGVTVTDGGGSPRKGKFADHTDEELKNVRRIEQENAAKKGKYSAQYQLNYNSKDIKGKNAKLRQELIEEIRGILIHTQPGTLYLHNPFDKHETHNAVTHAVLEALRTLPADKIPKNIYGCEVWRGLDWIPDHMKIPLDVSNYIQLQRELIDCHESQIEGSKGYTDATIGRQFANATFGNPHNLNEASAITYAIDLKPLVDNTEMTLEQFTTHYVDAFTRELAKSAQKYALHR